MAELTVQLTVTEAEMLIEPRRAPDLAEFVAAVDVRATAPVVRPQTPEEAAAAILATARREAAAVLEEAERRAVQRLAAADQMAEQTLSRAWAESARSRHQAERAAREVVASLQLRYREIVLGAHGRADHAAASRLLDVQAEQSQRPQPAEGDAQLQLRAVCLGASAEVSRAALAAALEAAEAAFGALLATPDGAQSRPAALSAR